ncbi:MAG: hypothetical protein ACKVRO_03175 [Micropepsaceae bacterium]
MFSTLDFAGLVVAASMILAPMSMMLTDRDQGFSMNPETSSSDNMDDLARMPLKPST